MARRHIKLKEWGTNVDEIRTVSEADAKTADGYLIPDAKYRLRTDENGFISTGNSSTSESPRVVVLGDSVVECMFVPEEQRFCAVVERELRTSGLDVQISNGGVTGSQLLNLYNSFLNKIVPLRPKLVVLMSGIIDLQSAVDPASFWTDFPMYSTLKSEPEIQIPWSEYKQNKVADWTDRTTIMKLFVYTAKLFNIQLAFATSAHRLRSEADGYMMQKFTLDWFERSSSVRYAVNQNTREFALASGLPLFDFEKLFEGRFDVFYDGLHLNEVGSVELGRVFAGYLAPLLTHVACEEEAVTV